MRRILLIITTFLSILGYGQSMGDFRSVASGSWGTASTWEMYNGSAWVSTMVSPGALAAGANVTIQNGHAVILTSSPIFSIANLTVGGGVSGGLGSDGSIRTLNVTGNLIVNAGGSLNLGSNNYTITGTTAVYGTVTDNSGSGTNIFTGLVTVHASGSFSTSNNSPFTFGGGITNAGTFSKGGTGTVTLSATQTVTANAATSITSSITASAGAHITYAGSNTLTLGGTCTYGGNLITTGTVAVVSGGTTTVAGNLTLGMGTTYTISGNTFTITGTSAINGSFVDNNANGVDTFIGKITIGATGKWDTSPINTTANLLIRGDFENQHTTASEIIFNNVRFYGGNNTISSVVGLDFGDIRIGNAGTPTTPTNLVITFNFNVNIKTGLAGATGSIYFSEGIAKAGTGFYIRAEAGTNGASTANGWVTGTFKRALAVGAPNPTLGIGTNTYYNPLILANTVVTTAGDFTAAYILGDHPNIATSCLNASRSDNKYLTYTTTATFTRLDLTIGITAAELDGGTTAANLVGGIYTGSNWLYPNVNGTPTTSVALRTVSLGSGQIQLAEVNSSYTVPGDPTVYGNGVWNGYAYNSTNFTNYKGYFSYSGLGFDTRTSDSYAVNGDPSVLSMVSNYQGCALPIDNFTVSFKRTNFPTGYYQLDYNGHDDGMVAYLNGVQIANANRPTYTAGAETALWIGELSTTSQLEFRWNEGTGGHFTSAVLTAVSPASLTAGSIYGNQSFCTSESVIKTLTSLSAASTGCSLLSYQWQSSLDNSTWADIAGATSTTYLPTGVTQTTYYRRKATDACNRVAYTNTITVNVYGTAPGTPTVYGDGQWIAYAYGATNFTNYKGYFTYSALNFDTRATDLIGNTASTLNMANTYLGCTMPVDNFSVRFRRTNIPAGDYQIDLNGHDDQFRIYKNGALIFQNNAYTAGAEPNAWTGSILPTDLIDLEWVEGTSGHFATFTMTLLGAAPSALVPGVISQNQTICTGDYPIIPLIGTAATGGCSVVPTYGTTTIYSGYQWETSYDGLNFSDIAGATSQNYTVPSSPTFNLDTWYRRRVTDQCGRVDYSNAIKITIDNTSYGNPSAYPSNEWRVYSYKDASFGAYAGYFPVATDSYDSQTYYTSAQSPYYATTYLGCTVPVTNYSTSVKRKGFTPGIYRITVTHDNEGRLLMDGNQVYNVATVVSTPVSVWIGPLNSNSQVDWRFVGAGAPNTTSISVTPFTPLTLTGGTIDGDKVVCRGDIPGPFTSLTLSSGGCYTDPTDYYWQYSTNGGSSWITLASSQGIGYTPVQTIFAETWYRRAVVDVCGNVAYSNIAKVTLNNTPPGNPAVFPSNLWNAYVYDDPDWGSYIGYFSVANTLDFDTRNYFCNNCAPSLASVPLANQGISYQGCQNVATNVGVKMRRQGVTTQGYYQIDLPYYDDEARLYINGVLVFSNPTWYNNTPSLNVWTGYLDANSTIDFWYQNDNGPGGAAIKFNYLGVTAPTGLIGGSIASQYATYCINDLPSFTSVTPASGACYPTYMWQYSLDNSVWNDITTASGVSYNSLLPITSLVYYRRKASDVCGNGPVYSNTITINPSGSSIGNPSVFGNGMWNAYVYASNVHAAPTSYVGYYTESALSFSTTTKFAATIAPSSTIGYQGCQTSATNYTVAYKRTNFTSGTYQIDINTHDDNVTLVINGVAVFKHNTCCDAHSNVWTGILGPSSQVELRYTNINGPGSLQATITAVTPVGMSSGGTIAGTQTVCNGGAATALTETVAGVSGCYVYYQWQSSTDNVTFNDIANATSNTYTPVGAISQVTYFRRKATDACNNVDYSNTLTVSPLPAVVAGTAGVSGTYCATASVPLNPIVPASGGNGSYTYQWQSSADNITYANIGGATSANYTVPSFAVSTYYRRQVTSCGTTVNGNVVYLQLGTGTAITQQPPATYTVCSGATASISLVATGLNVTYQWQYFSGGSYVVLSNTGNYSGVSTNTLQIANVTNGVNTGNYRCVVSGSCSPTTVTSGVVAVSIGGPTIALQPVNTTVCQNSDTTLSVVASGSLTYQWQESTNSGSSWTPLSNAGIYSGVNTNKLRFTNTSGINNNQYRVVVTSSCGATTSSAATVTIQSPIAINTITGGTVCSGNSLTLTGNAVTSASYQWYLDNAGVYTAISGATGQNLTINVTSSQNYKRRVIVNTCANMSSALPVAPASAYTITTQPAATTTQCTGVATISVAATNVTAYQWQISTDGGSNYSSIGAGGIYSGVNTNTLSINVTPALSGNRYRVRLTGCNGTGTSNSSLLISNTTLSYTSHPSNTSSCINGSTTMSVVASSNPSGSSLTYKWQYNLGSATGNAFVDISSNSVVFNYTTATITISNPGLSLNGAQFRCIASSPCASSSVISNVATLTVYDAITGNGISTAQTICNGEVPQLLTGSNPPAGGNGVFTYQWMLSTGSGYSNISGATSFDYQPPALTTTSNYQRVAYSGNCQSVTSFPIQIQVGAATSVVTNPTDANTCAGTNATFTVVGGGTALQYQWQTDNGTGTFSNITDVVNYSGKTSATLTVITPSFAYNGYKYRVVINGNCLPENVTSAFATLNLSSAPVITMQPSFAGNVCEDASTTVSVNASGTGLSYQWQSKTGAASFVNISGAPYSNQTTATLTINPVSAALNGTQYRCVVTQASCSVNSNAATLPVINKPVITVHPTDRTVCSGVSTSMTAAATGAGLTYQWQMTPPVTFTNVSGPYSGGASTTLQILAPPLASNGKKFRIRVSGTCTPTGVFSNQATLTVNGAGYWTGATNTDWNTNSNWCVAKPTSADDVTISGGLTNYPIVSSSSPLATAKSIVIANNASLTITGANQLEVYGNWNNNGNFVSHQSTVSFISSSPQAIGGVSKSVFNHLKINNTHAVGMAVNTDIKVKSTLELDANTLVDAGGNSIILMSDATGTARLLPVPASSSYQGNLTMQRYIPAKRAPRYVSVPVTGATIAQFKDSTIIAGPATGGFDTPNTSVSTFKNYDETRGTWDYNKGWVSATSVNQALKVGAGYYLYVPGRRTTVFPSAEEVTLQVKGTPHIGNKTVNLTYSASGIQGWNLIGNPYPSQIDWDSPSITKTNIDNALYTWDATATGQGQYYSYVNGVASPAKANPSIIPSMNGFFVKANTTGASISFTENAKVGSTHYSVFRKAPIADLLRFKLLANGAVDDAVVYYADNATNRFNKEVDARKMLNSELNIYTHVEGDMMSINAISKSVEDTIEIPLVVTMKTKGTFEIDFSEIRLRDWQDLYLYDKFLNVYVPLIQGNSYLAEQNEAKGSYAADRFLITNRLSSSQVITSNMDMELGGGILTAYPNPVRGEALNISLTNFKGASIYIEILSAEGVKVYSGSVLNNKVLTLDVFKQLSSGIYILKAMDADITKQIHIAKIN